MKPIYIVDDEASICETLTSILREEGYPVHAFADAHRLLEQMQHEEPALVLLDIWLPGIDGMEILKKLKQQVPALPVIMISGHAGIEAAVGAIKAGAYDFLEKPLHLEVLLDKIASALSQQPRSNATHLPSDTRLESAPFQPLEGTSAVAKLASSVQPQRTLKNNVVLNGTGLLSGRNTGLILSALGINQGLIFQCLDGQTIRGHITSLENFAQSLSNQSFTANSTVLTNQNRRIRTVEHLLAVLHMYGLTNVLIKVDEEIPNIDGSAEDFCRLIEEAGIQDQEALASEVVIQQKVGVGLETPEEKYLYIEPFDGFEVTMRVHYPAPIFEQSYTFNPARQSFAREIARARSFNTFENIDMAQKLGKVGTGYLNSHIIMHDGKVINTELRYPDEFVRHKILDLIGDLYLLGMPLRGRVVANMTSHGYNQALVQKIYAALTFTGTL